MREVLVHQQDSIWLQADLADGQLNGEMRIEAHGRLLSVLRYRTDARWMLRGNHSRG